MLFQFRIYGDHWHLKKIFTCVEEMHFLLKLCFQFFDLWTCVQFFWFCFYVMVNTWIEQQPSQSLITEMSCCNDFWLNDRMSNCFIPIFDSERFLIRLSLPLNTRSVIYGIESPNQWYSTWFFIEWFQILPILIKEVTQNIVRFIFINSISTKCF